MKGPQLWRSLGMAVVVLSMLAACTGRQGPPGPAFAEAQIPALAPDHARIFFYRDYEPYEGLTRPYIRLNGKPISIAESGGVSFRDVVPGTYLISTDTAGQYPDQNKTLAFAAGSTTYIKIESNFAYNVGCNTALADTLVVVPMDAAQAERELRSMIYVSGT